jgi:hypothetical protein
MRSRLPDLHAELFAKKQKYGVFVWASRSPVLNDYVIQMLDSIMEELRKVRLRHGLGA